MAVIRLQSCWDTPYLGKPPPLAWNTVEQRHSYATIDASLALILWSHRAFVMATLGCILGVASGAVCKDGPAVSLHPFVEIYDACIRRGFLQILLRSKRKYFVVEWARTGLWEVIFSDVAYLNGLAELMRRKTIRYRYFYCYYHHHHRRRRRRRHHHHQQQQRRRHRHHH